MTEAIRRRTSCRTYSNEPLSAETRAGVEALLGRDHTGPFGNRVRFELLEFGPGVREGPARLSTYGLITNGRYFVAGAVARGPDAGHDYGYCLERVVLELTLMGLGTCWIAAFGRAAVAGRMQRRGGEICPAIAVVGWPAAHRGLKERLVRRAAGADGRKPWGELFREAGTGRPLTPEEVGEWREPLAAVRAGPSASNRQRWRVLMEREAAAGAGGALSWHFGSAGAPGVDLGIAMLHFEAVAGEAGLPGGWERVAAGRLPTGVSYVVSWAVGAAQS
jgi:nitroreductase